VQPPISREHGGVYKERASVIEGAIAWQAVHDGSVRVLPDGCMDLLWMDGRVVVAGPDAVAHVHAATAGERVLGLRFRPGVLPSLLGVPAEHLVGRRVPLGQVVDGARWRPVISPDQDPLDLPDPTATFEHLVRPALTPDPVAPEGWDLAARSLERGMPVAELAQVLGYSERQLSRRCRQHVGYGPAHLRRVLRLQRALALRREGARPSAAAALAGYADASHLHRDARDLAGVPLAQLS
jgi:AraC-like DNA-binding protein